MLPRQRFFQTRPLWGQENNYFSELAGRPKPDERVLPRGRRRRRSDRPEQDVLLLRRRELPRHPVAQRVDRVPDRRGAPGRLLAADQFGGPAGHHLRPADAAAVLRQHHPRATGSIPSPRRSPVTCRSRTSTSTTAPTTTRGRPRSTTGSSRNTRSRPSTSSTIAISLTGFYLYNRTDEPDANYFEVGLNGSTRFADPNDYLLKRRPQILALNNTWVLSNDSVLALRFGWTQFVDNNTMTIDFDPADLGFSQTFLSQVDQTGVPKFPNGSHGRLQQLRRDHAVVPHLQVLERQRQLLEARRHGTPSSSARDYRRIGVYLLNPGDSSGRVPVRQGVHLRHRAQQQQHDRRQRVRQLSARISVRQCRAAEHDDADDAARHLYQLLRRLLARRLAREHRLTLNFGLRVEHEDGMREVDDNFTVGFDPAAGSALSTVTIPADSIAGTPARQVSGGLMFAGVDGNKVTQGNLPAAQWSPRAGIVYSLTPTTALRAGYGLYWAPWNYPVPEQREQQLRSARLHPEHGVAADRRNADGVADKPVPERARQPARQQPGGTHRRRHVDQLRRPEPHRAARAAVLGGPAEGAAGPHGADA